MGYISHHAIVVTGFEEKYVVQAHEKAKEIFNMEYQFSEGLTTSLNLVSEIIEGINGYSTFLIAPDGSKEGWQPSNIFEKRREEFILWLKNISCYYDWALIQFGNEDNLNSMLQASGGVEK